jgi:twinkle protein
MSAEEQIAGFTETGRYRCPSCADQRKKSKLKTLSVTVHPDHTLYDCHHCGFAGRVNSKPMYQKPIRKIVQLPTKMNENNSLIAKFFAKRGVELPDITDLPIVTGTKWFGALEKEVPAIGFVYGPMAEPTAIKWRPADGRKAFTQDGKADTFYGIDRLKEPKQIIIVEGEADWVALHSIGIESVSWPNGAPHKITNKRIHPSEDKKFACVWENREILSAAERIILAVDNDEAGDALAEELARRVGRAKCWRVNWPEEMKDANEVLQRSGEAAVREAIKQAEPMPLDGVYSASSYFDQVLDLHREGHGRGAST